MGTTRPILQPAANSAQVDGAGVTVDVAFYRRALLEDVIPFWLRHGLDRVHGGLSNVMDDAGRILSHDKYLWSQGRALWTFSALLNRVGPRPEWREAADHLFQYLAAHGRDEAGRWMYRLAPDGRVLDGPISLYVDGFVMNGMAEYHRATGNATAARLALETGEGIRDLLSRPGSYTTAPYVIPAGLKAHGVAMIFSFFLHHLGRTLGRPDFTDRGLVLAHEILEQFYVPQTNAVMEYVRLDGRPSDSPHGRLCIPGHALESMWFLITMFETAGDADRIALCCRLIRRHLELGWDETFGGLRLALDIEGRGEVPWQKPDCKAWWAQVEALVATARAYRHTRDPVFLEWHERVREYAWSHYPVPTGEWRQWLDREGRPTSSAALPVKDPFHLPRALLMLIEPDPPAP